MIPEKTYPVRLFNDPALNILLAQEKRLYRPPLVIKGPLVKIIFCLVVSYISAVIVCEPFFYISLFLLILLFSKQIAVGCIHLYQRYAPAQTRLKCCMYPSCSQYTAMAIKRYGVVIGMWKGYIRMVKRCKPPGERDFP